MAVVALSADGIYELCEVRQGFLPERRLTPVLCVVGFHAAAGVGQLHGVVAGRLVNGTQVSRPCVCQASRF
jgi:hypothetical protein